jgi:hypothetical protein
MVKHLRVRHPAVDVSFCCSRCGKPGERLHGAMVHYARCGGGRYWAGDFLCEYCGRAFGSQMGLSLHMKHVHPSERNEQRSGKMRPPPYRRPPWGEDEERRLLSYYNLWRGVEGCRRRIATRMGRTEDEIMRKIEELREGGVLGSTVVEIEVLGGDGGDGGLWEWNPCPVGDVDQDRWVEMRTRIRQMWDGNVSQEDIDEIIECLERALVTERRPHVHRRGGRQGRGKKVREYARTQVMFNRAPNDLARLVLDNRTEQLLRPATGKEKPPERAVEAVRAMWSERGGCHVDFPRTRQERWKIKPITAALVREKIKKMKDGATGLDGVTQRSLEEHDGMAGVLSELFNLMLE